LWQDLFGTETRCPLDAVPEARVALLAASPATRLLGRTSAAGRRARIATPAGGCRTPPLRWPPVLVAPLRALAWCVHLDPLSDVGYAQTLCYYPFDLARRARKCVL
jgi:hypothetical protein